MTYKNEKSSESFQDSRDSCNPQTDPYSEIFKKN